MTIREHLLANYPNAGFYTAETPGGRVYTVIIGALKFYDRSEAGAIRQAMDFMDSVESARMPL